jgi:hypothetical protein
VNEGARRSSRLISGFCSSPRSFGFGFLQTLPRDNAFAVSLDFGSAKTWLQDFYLHSYVPCPAHTFRFSDGAQRCPLQQVVKPPLCDCNGYVCLEHVH